MTKILFVCLGNICRSTMAEYVMKHLVKQAGLEREFFIDSAGTSNEEEGNGVHYGTRRRLQQAGIPCGGHRARQMTAADYGRFDLLIGMEESNLRAMRRIAGGDPEGKIRKLLDFSGRGGDIADPWYTGNFDATFDDVMEGCQALLAYCKGKIVPCAAAGTGTRLSGKNLPYDLPYIEPPGRGGGEVPKEGSVS